MYKTEGGGSDRTGDLVDSFQPNTALRHLLMMPKDRVQESEMVGVVYQIHCAACPATYVGQTGRHLNQWLSWGTQATQL